MSAEPIFVDLSESKPTEIESLCMKCQENGTTRILLSKIPHFKQVLLYTARKSARKLTCHSFE
ncbi:unnamed protein product [Mucor hiemalis]